MIKLDNQQKNALWILRNAIDELHQVLDHEVSTVLVANKILPERDLLK